MININLKANNDREQTVLENLIPMLSETLADKINNGVYIEKDGKQLLNKKDLTGFMKYAEEQAKEQIAENLRKGVQAVCVHGNNIMNWAIHYFEEDSIEGTLFNEDGTEYEPPKPVKKTTTSTTPITSYTPPAPKPKPQLNIFDMLADDTKNNTPTEQVHSTIPEQNNIAEYYQHYCSIQEKYPEFVIAFRLGDFYEIFGEDAVKISDDLDLTLTSKDVGLQERIPIIGFSCREMKTYISKIINHEHKLAVVDSLDNIRRFTAQGNQIVEIETGEILDEETTNNTEDTQCFNEDINENDELMTVSKLIGDSLEDDETEATDLLNIPTEADDDFDLEKERQVAKAFDVEAMIILQELFDNKMTIV